MLRRGGIYVGEDVADYPELRTAHTGQLEPRSGSCYQEDGTQLRGSRSVVSEGVSLRRHKGPYLVKGPDLDDLMTFVGI